MRDDSSPTDAQRYPGLSPAGAEILRCRAKHFDPAIVDVFLPNIEGFEEMGRMLERKSARWK